MPLETTGLSVLGAGTGAYVPTDPAHTQVGAPTTGNHAAGEVFVDANGAIWACSAGGTPGTWFAAGSGVELGEAELSGSFTLSSTAAADLTGLSVTFVAPARAFLLELTVPNLGLGNTTQNCAFQITDSANVLIQAGTTVSGSGASTGAPVFLRTRLPNIGTGSYPITVGQSYTFKARYAMSSVAGGNGVIANGTGISRPSFRAVTC